MRSALLAIALALGIGFAVPAAQAMAPGGNLAQAQTLAKSGSPVIQQAHYRRYWHRHYRRHYWWRYHRRHYWWRHHHRYYYWR